MSIKCKTIEEYREAIREALADQWGGSEMSYCDYSGVPYSSLRKFMRGEYDTMRPINMRAIKEDLGIELENQARSVFPSKGGIGIKMYTNSVPGKIISSVDGKDLYTFAKDNKRNKVNICILINDIVAAEKHDCSAVLYLNNGEEGCK